MNLFPCWHVEKFLHSLTNTWCCLPNLFETVTLFGVYTLGFAVLRQERTHVGGLKSGKFSRQKKGERRTTCARTRDIFERERERDIGKTGGGRVQ